MSKTVLKVIKTTAIPLDSVWAKAFLGISPDFTKLIVFLDSDQPGRVETRAGVTCFHSPIKNRKHRTAQARWLAALLVEHNVDIIHCDQHSPTLIGVKAKKIAAVPYLFSHVHGLNMCRGVARKLFYLLNRRHITKIIACSEVVRQNILSTFPGYGQDKVVTIANAIDPDKFDPKAVDAEVVQGLRHELGLQPTEILFLALCRLSPDKNLDLLFRAFAESCRQLPNLKLVVAGNGRLEQPLRKLITDLGMAHNITMLGFRSDVKELLAASDVVIQPSKREGFCITVLEAAAMAKPIIFSRTGCAELLEGICDQFLVTPNVELELTHAIIKMAQLAPGQRLAIGQALADRARRSYTYAGKIAETEKLYRQTLSEGTNWPNDNAV